ncbi:MAG: hybrid sensor histidine kinase/response regulator [Pedosphaera sp.]|nr:hybrid sensor histidine kinase/response regulator [Pedosphaera sp.]
MTMRNANLPTLRNISIKRKLTLIIMAASTVALLLISSAFVLYELITFRQSMTRDISTLAEIIGNQSTAALAYDDRATAEEILGALSAKQHIVSACIYKDGKVFARYPKNASPATFPLKPKVGDPTFGDDHLVLFHPVMLKGDVVGTIYLQSDLLEMRERLVRYGGIILLFMLASSLVTYFLSALLQKIISQPISHLVDTAKAVSTEKNYSVRAVKRSEDELGQLIDGFNEMLTQIQERDVALQQAHDKLEKRVGERTQDLQMEIAERRRTQEALQQQLTRISLLNQITHVVSEREDLPSILQVVLRQLEDHLPVDVGMVYLLEPGGETLSIAALRENSPRLTVGSHFCQGATMSIEQTGLGQCRLGETVYIPETARPQAELIQSLSAAGLQCAVAVPLMVEGKLFGILAVARLAVKSFSSGECEFLRMLSQHVALAAHQAQLHAELGSAYDDLRQTQMAVMQQDRLRALGQMASGIAHDINNALSPVVGFASLLISYEPNLSQNAKKHLNYIKTAGEDVAHIVARLREFYRQREGKEPMFPLNLNQLVDQVVDMTRPRWRDIPQGRGITVEMETLLAEDLPEVVGLESEVREAMTNLILNAVDAMPNGGTLTVRTRSGGLVAGFGNHGDHGPTHGILEVSDTGTGMSDEMLRRCMEPFFSTKGKRGTGMGLAMVYGVMERHEGKIEIQSELGRGTTVRLIFPLRGLADGDSPVSETGKATSQLQILCIDDEPLLRELVKEMLECDGHQVQVADSGQTGLDAFHRAAERGRAFDVVITDLGMPYLDGRQVARTLKNESPKTPIIMLTGWGAFMKSDGDVPAHVDGILSKPPRMNEMRGMLTRLTKK